MTFRSRLYHRPTIFRLAMLCLLLFSASAYLARGASGARADLIDGVRGLFLGLEIGLIYWWFRLPAAPRCNGA